MVCVEEKNIPRMLILVVIQSPGVGWAVLDLTPQKPVNIVAKNFYNIRRDKASAGFITDEGLFQQLRLLSMDAEGAM